MNGNRPNLEDARALLDRARKHRDEFSVHTSPQSLWQGTEFQDSATGEWVYRLYLDQVKLVSAKSVLADCANNLISALDHVAAAIARTNGHGRLRSLYFPLGSDCEAYRRALQKKATPKNKITVRQALGEPAVKLITRVRLSHRSQLPGIVAAKEISSSGKHWQLMSPDASALAVALLVPGSGQFISDFPPDAFANSDSFEFYRGVERLPRTNMETVLQLTLVGLDDTLPKSPDSILDGAFQFVEAVVGAVSSVDV